MTSLVDFAPGSLCFWMEVPHPIKPTTLIKRQISGGLFTLSFNEESRLVAQICQHDSTPLYTITSCKVVTTAETSAFFAASWELPDTFFVMINDRVAASIQDKTLSEGEFFLPVPGSGPSQKPISFTKQNAEQLSWRKKKLAEYTPLVNRIPGDKESDFAALDAEIKQIQDLLRLVEGGAVHHIGGIFRSVRALVTMGNPLPLLQRCAAHVDAPLIVYCSSNPMLFNNIKHPAAPVVSLNLDLSAVPNRHRTNPVDLGVWLNFPAASLGEEIFSHEAAIRAMANTTAAHIDKDILPLVDYLRKLRSAALGGPERDLLAEYVLVVASTIHQLGKHVLSIK